MFRALVTVFAGYWRPSLATRAWVSLFFLMVRLQRWMRVFPRLAPTRSMRSMNQPPLPAETRYWNRADDRQRVVNALFDRSAEHYDRACGIMSFGSGQRYRREALERAGLRPGMRVLDVGTGTGLLAREIAHVLGSSGRVVGLDPVVAA